jgi:hypothetical protein
MRHHGNDRRSTSGDPYVEMFTSLLGDEIRKERNRSRLMRSNPIWIANGAGMALCPAFDDFLIATDMSDRIVTVPITTETFADFIDTVRPALYRHQQAATKFEENRALARQDNILGIADDVLGGRKFSRGEDLTLALSYEDTPGYGDLNAAYVAVVTALRAFVKRHVSA